MPLHNRNECLSNECRSRGEVPRLKHQAPPPILARLHRVEGPEDRLAGRGAAEHDFLFAAAGIRHSVADRLSCRDGEHERGLADRLAAVDRAGLRSVFQ